MTRLPNPMRPALLASALLIAASASASDTLPTSTLIVMDGSGSMWGQIDGRPKLEIARETVAQVLGTLPADQPLGLMAYGHRRKGDCKDIELMVPPAAGTAPAVLKAVNTMQFLGKTPLSEAVRQAAQAMDYTNDIATVVLVTDGLETCAADPCAMAAELEKSGVNFTAHVIGFGLTKEEGAKVSCIAENTGGRYLQASDGASLTAALTSVVRTPAAAPKPAARPTPPKAVGNATLDAPASAPVGSPVAVRWTGPADEQDAIVIAKPNDSETETVEYGYVKDGNPITLTMPAEPGTYELRYRNRDQFIIATRPIQATAAQATLTAPDSAGAGSTVVVRWTGPRAAYDNIQIAEAGSEDYLTYVYLDETQQVELTMPDKAGAYQLRYKFRDREIIARRAIQVTGGQ